MHDHAQPARVARQGEAKAERPEPLHQLVAVLGQPARKALPGEIACPRLRAVPLAHRHAELVRAGRREAHDLGDKAGKGIAAPFDRRSSVRTMFAQHIVHRSHGGLQQRKASPHQAAVERIGQGDLLRLMADRERVEQRLEIGQFKRRSGVARARLQSAGKRVFGKEFGGEDGDFWPVAVGRDQCPAPFDAPPANESKHPHDHSGAVSAEPAGQALTRAQQVGGDGQ